MKKTISLLMILTLGAAVEVANADYLYGTPTNFGPIVNSSFVDAAPNISADGLSLFFASTRPGGLGSWGIWVATRATTDDDWGEPVNIGTTVSSSAGESTPNISTDGLTLYFGSTRSGGFDIWMTTRATTDDDWGAPVKLGPPINTSGYEGFPSISADGLELYFDSDRPGDMGGGDIWMSTRETKEHPWSEPVHLGPTVNSSSLDASANISSDGLALFFQSNRPGGHGGVDIWVTTRTTTEDAWSTPVNLGPAVNTSDNDLSPDVSFDGSTLYFSSWTSGGYGKNDLWKVSIDPVVDLNGDGIVDAADRSIIMDHWGTDEPLCDIGPMPWGDGIVDMQDLLVLTEYLEPIDTLIAHWALDEAEGITAHDSVSGNDDIIMGDPLWQPTGGKVDGALELDGVTNCIIPATGPNPAEKPFSIFTWIKGGAPSQVIVSQPLGSNWLEVDADGTLMTELKASGTGQDTLLSQAVITDDQWHHIGLVWDGLQRMLCADGVVVAEDTPDGLEPSAGGLYIGVGNNWAAGSFFSGLIDDVRIYGQALSAEDIAALAQQSKCRGRLAL